MKAGWIPSSGPRLSRPAGIPGQRPGAPPVLLAAFALLQLTGCAHRGIVAAPPPVVQLAPAIMPAPPPADSAVLAGHRIVIDPGHGGKFYGAVGPRGLRESTLNLDVARLLASSLRRSGAEVLLTRDSDSDFVNGDSTRLRDDLEARSARANAFHPEAFLSIHHNADARRDSSRNGLETYYRLRDAGPSFDLASNIHRSLYEGEALPRAELIAGNYYVLRRSQADAALLGEASYLSNPGNETLLMTPARRILEATAYYRGLADYFRAGVPRLVSADPGAATLERLPPALSAEFQDGPGGQALDPNSIQASLDEKLLRGSVIDRLPPAAGAESARALPGHLRASLALPADLAAGPHTIQWSARNLNGNSLPASPRRFIFDPPPASLRVRTIPADLGALAASAGDMYEIVVEASDARGQAVEGRSGMLRLSAGWFALPEGDFTRDSLPFSLRQGVFHAVVRGSPKSLRNALISAHLPGLASASAEPGAAPAGELCLVRARTLRGEKVVALAGATVLWDRDVLGRTDEAGFLGARLPHGHGRLDSLQFVAPGCLGRTYLVRSVESIYTVDLGESSDRGSWPHFCFDQVILPRVPEADLLMGRRIALDPLPLLGPEDGGAAGDSRDLNLDVARALKEYLEAAGAEVLITRGAGDAPTRVARLGAVEQFGAERLLLLSHLGTPAFYHNPGSGGSRQWCQGQARLWNDMGAGGHAIVGEDARYLLRQSSGSAMLAELGEAGALEAPATQRARIRREALALYQGIVQASSADPARLGGLGLRFGASQAHNLVRVDGGLLLELDREGRANLPAMAPGYHRVDAEIDGDGMWGLVEVQAGKVHNITDGELRPYSERIPPKAGLPDAAVHQRYPEEISPDRRVPNVPGAATPMSR